MAQINNSIAQKPLPDKPVTYMVNGEEVTLSPSIVYNFLTNGNTQITRDEIAYFMNICKYQKLNPLIKDAFLVKYGSQPAAIIVSKDALLKRAQRNPRYRGHEAGVIVQYQDSGQLENRVGSLVLPNENMVGGWAKVYVEGYQVPIESAVSFREYAQTTRDGNLNSMWGGKPGTMIRKVALSTALREAFPEDLGGLYEAEEVGADINPSAMPDIPDQPDPVPDPDPEPEPIPLPNLQEEDFSQIPPDYDEPQMDTLPPEFE